MNRNDLKLYPLAQVNGVWNVPDEHLVMVWEKIGGLADTVFAVGEVKSADDFVTMCKNPHNLVVFVFHMEHIIGFAWLNGMSSSYAFGHFCFFPESWGKNTLEAGELVLDYWFGIGIFNTILGMVPGFNVKAHAYVKRLGFTHLGTIPGMLDFGRETAEIFYLSRPKDGQE